MKALAVFGAVLVLASCGDAQAETTADTTHNDPSPTVAPSPTPTVEPTPIPTPTPDQTQQVAQVAAEWTLANPNKVGGLVAEAVLASPDAENLSPLVRVGLGDLVQAFVTDEVGNQIGVNWDSVTYHGGVVFGARFIVAGKIADLGPVDLVDVSVPILLTVDLGSEDVTEWEADLEEATVAIEVGG